MTGHSIRNPRYVAVLAVAAVVILATGISVRRAIDTGKPEPPAPSESDLLRLGRLSQRRSLEDIAEYLGSVAEQTRRSIVPVPELGATGIVWPDGLVLTAGLTQPVRDAEIAGPQLPIVAIKRAQPGTKAATLRSEAARPGEWIVAVWRNGTQHAYEAGNVGGTASATCQDRSVHSVLTTIVLVPSMAGAGIFDVDGRLLAVVVRCDQALNAISAADVEAMLEGGRTDENRVGAIFGLRVTGLTPEETRYFMRPHGLIVREIWQDSKAARSDLRPGDLVKTVNDRPITAPQDLQKLLLSNNDEAFLIAIERRGGSRTITITRDAGEPSSDQGSGITLRSDHDYPIAAVTPNSAAARAGLRPGDVVLRIDQMEPRNLTEVRRRLAATGQGRPVFLEVQRGSRRWGVLLI